MQEEYRTLQRWPWEEEDISTEEYIRSLQGLIHFLNDVDVSAIRTLEDVSAVASLVGHDLHTIVIVKGIKIEKKTEKLEPGASEPISHIEREYVLTHYVGNREVVVTAGDGCATISERGIVGFQRFQREDLKITLPSDRDIAIGNTPNVDEESMYALDLRGGRVSKYYPTQEPDSPEIQQRFTYILKDAIKSVTTIVAMHTSATRNVFNF